MRLVLVAVTTLVLALLLGFEPSFGPTFRTTFPENPGRDEGTVDLSALPVVVHDFTGLVTGVDIVEDPVPDRPFFDRITQVDGDPTAIRVDWVGGACESRVTVVVFEVGDRYGLTVGSSGTPWIPGCSAVGTYRSLMVSFRQPMAPHQFRLRSPSID